MVRRRSANADPLPALVVSREDFLRHYWTYKPGEHVTVAGPTGWGKTLLINQLMNVTATSRMPSISLCMKTRDDEYTRHIRETPGVYRVGSWPPSVTEKVKMGTAKPRGWVLWPKPGKDINARAVQLYTEFRSAFLESMNHKGARIIVADDMNALQVWLRMTQELRYVYWNGRSDKTGLWGAVQRPAHAPPEAYSQSSHAFFANSPEKRDRDRYREIGGVDAETLEYNLSRCRKYQWLYVHRETGGILIIDA